MTVSNELNPSAFVSSPDIKIALRRGPFIKVVSRPSPYVQVACSTSREVKLPVFKAAKTPSPPKPDSLTVLAVLAGSSVAGWDLKSLLLVQLRRTRRLAVATTWLEGLAEYGTGKSDAEAVADLVVSLGEYRESLERRRRKLGASARGELALLRNLIQRSPGDSGLSGTP